MPHCYVCDEVFASSFLSTLEHHEPQIRQLAETYRQEYQLPPISDNVARVCRTCIRILISDNRNSSDSEYIQWKVPRPRNSVLCCVCGRGPVGVVQLNDTARVQIYVDTDIYIGPLARVCWTHMDGEFLQPEEYNNLKIVHRPVHLVGAEVGLFLQNLREQALKKEVIEEKHLTNDDFVTVTSLSKSHFLELFTYCDPVPDGDRHRTVKKKDLLTFLRKMRQGLSDEFLRILFGYSTRQAVSLAVSMMRRSLMLRFVPTRVRRDYSDGVHSASCHFVCKRTVQSESHKEESNCNY